MSIPFRVLLPASADRELWLTARRAGLGSADIPDILGVGHGQAQEVYYDKIGALPLDRDAGEAAFWGRADKDATARHWAERNRAAVRRIGLIGRKDEPWQMATLDRQVIGCLEQRRKGPRIPGVHRPVCALQVKHTNAWVAGKWKRAIPDDVLAQVLWQMTVTGYDHLHVACRIGGSDYRQFTVRRDDHAVLLGDIVAQAAAFWHDNVRTRRVPPLRDGNTARTLAMLEALHPNRAGVVHLTGVDAVAAEVQLDQYEEMRLRAAHYGQAQADAKAKLIELLGEAEAARLYDDPVPAYGLASTTRDGDPMVTSNCDLARLAEHHPDVYADVVETKPTRRFNIARRYRKSRGDVGVPA